MGFQRGDGENGSDHGQEFSVPCAILDAFPVLAYRADRATLPRPVTREIAARPPRSLAAMGVGVLALVAAGVALFLLTGGDVTRDARDPRSVSRVVTGTPPLGRTASSQQSRPRSRAVGSATDGRLVNGVALSTGGRHFFTWNLPRGVSPNPRFRRFATGRVIHRTLAAISAYRRANPNAPRVGIGDLSLPQGGPFGTNYGGTGHVGHRNGTEVDILYPRRDSAPRPVQDLAQVDRRLTQALLDSLLAAGATSAVVDGRMRLSAPPGKIKAAPFHEEHLHVTF